MDGLNKKVLINNFLLIFFLGIYNFEYDYLGQLTHLWYNLDQNTIQHIKYLYDNEGRLYQRILYSNNKQNGQNQTFNYFYAFSEKPQLLTHFVDR